MATSSIRFADKDIFLSDEKIGLFIQAVTNKCEELIQQHPEQVAALLGACNQWSDDYEQMPPGLKDIELDPLLATEDVRVVFETVLRSILDETNESHMGDNVPSQVSERILKEFMGVDNG